MAVTGPVPADRIRCRNPGDHHGEAQAMCPRFLFGAAALLAASTATAGLPIDPHFVHVGHRIDIFDQAAASGLAIADVDADGRDDAVFLGLAGGPVLFVAGRAPYGMLDIKSSQRVADDGAPVRTLAATVQGTPRILTLGSNGIVRLYGGWPLVEMATRTVEPDALAAEIGDADGDGHDDLVVLTADQILRYDLDSGALTGSLPTSGYASLALGHLDADPALEIVLGGAAPGRVLDGATFATDWSYVDSFGPHVVAGRFAPDPTTRWFGLDTVYTLYRAEPWSPLWSATAHYPVTAAAAGDLDGSGHELLLFGSIHDARAVDPLTQQEVWLRSSIFNGVERIAAADLDGTGLNRVLYSGSRGAEMPLLTLIGIDSPLPIWTHTTPTGRFKSVALGDVDGDGRIELVTAAQGEHFGTLAIFDAENGREKWRNERTINESAPFFLAAHDIQLLPHEDSAGMSILFAGESRSRGRATVANGVTMQAEHLLPDDRDPMSVRRAVRSATLDYDGDGTRDYAFATEALEDFPAGAKIYVYSGTDSRLLWTSPVIGTSLANVHNLFAVPQDDGDTELVVALNNGLRAFSAASGLLTWSLGAPLDGATWIAQGASGPEIVVFSATGDVTVYDYATRTPQRSFTLPAPLRAIAAPKGDASLLIAASNGRLLQVDGISGAVGATTEVFDSMEQPMQPLATLTRSQTSWLIAAATDHQLVRFRLDLDDRVFQGGFD